MIIIVEGIDRVGKTTLVNKLTKECNIKPFIDSYLSFEYIDLEGFVAYVDGCRDNIIANTEKINSLINFFEQFSDKIGNVLLDRFHVSEYVYGLCDRKYISREVFDMFDERLSKLNTLIVYVEPKDLDWSSEQHGSSLKKHNGAFNYIIGKTKCEVIRCNFDTLDETVLKIKEKLTNDNNI